jgi:hypothetical protein
VRHERRKHGRLLSYGQLRAIVRTPPERGDWGFTMAQFENQTDYLAGNYPGMFSHTTPRPIDWEGIFAAIGKVAVVLFTIWMIVGWLGH